MRVFIIVFITLLTGCSGQREKQESKDVKKSEKSLYDQVMDVHDEVMPRMNELQKLKRKLQDTLTKGSELTADKRRELERKIMLLDSASRSMMNWMYEFQPDELKGDSLDHYLKNEMERINKVKELILEAIKQASVDG